MVERALQWPEVFRVIRYNESFHTGTSAICHWAN